MDSAAADNEERLAGTLAELDKAEAKLSAYERAFRAPREKVEPATKGEIADAQKTSREASPRWQSEQNRIQGKAIRRQVEEYRNYIIHFYQKPVPGFGDWSFNHKDYDGAPDGPGTSCRDHRCGYARTPQEAKVEIDAQYEDFELDENGHYT